MILRLAFAEGWLVRSADWAFSFVFGRSAASVARSAVVVMVVVGQGALLVEAVLGDRVPVFRSYVRALGRLAAWAPKVAARAARAIYDLVEGKPEGGDGKRKRR